MIDNKSLIGRFDNNVEPSKVQQVSIFGRQLSNAPIGITQSSMGVAPANIRDIELLSVEEFGHNTKALRKDIGVTHAVGTNTDTEIGVIAADDKFASANVSSVPIYEFTDAWAIDGYLGNVAKIDTIQTELDDIDDIDNIKINSSNKLLLFPHVMHRQNHVGGLQYISVTDIDEDDKYRINNSTEAAAEAVGNISILGPAYKLDSNTYGTRVGSTEDGVLTITNFSTTHDIHIYSGYAGDGGLWTSWQTTKIDRSTGTAVEIEWDFLTALTDGRAKNIVLYAIWKSDDVPEYTFVTFPFTESILIVTNQMYTPNTIRGFDIGFKTAEAELKPVGLSDWKFKITGYDDLNGGPEISNIQFRLNSDPLVDKIQCKSFPFAPVSNVFDLKNNYIFKAVIKDYNTTDAIYKSSRIIANGINSIELVIPEGVPEYYKILIDNITGDGVVAGFPTTYPSCSFYTNVITISQTHSIGYMRRSDGTITIGVKHTSLGVVRYYTARGSYDFNPSERVIESIDVLSSKKKSISFIVASMAIDDSKNRRDYYTFSEMYEYDGGILHGANYSDQVVFTMVDITNDTSVSVDTGVSSIGTKSVEASLYSYDDILPLRITNSNKFLLSQDASSGMSINTMIALHRSVLIFRDVIDYAARSICIPIQMGYGASINSLNSADISVDGGSYLFGSSFSHILSMPKLTNTDDYSELPIKAEDEYTGVKNTVGVGDRTFSIGKSNIVSYGGSVYEASSMSMIADTRKRLLSVPGSIVYSAAGLLFMAKSGLTTVHTFNELGVVIHTTLDDELISNPVILQIGIMCLCRNGIYLVSGNGTDKIYSTESISSGAIATMLDNSALAIYYSGSSLYSVSINRMGQVSSQTVFEDGDNVIVSGVINDSIFINNITTNNILTVRKSGIVSEFSIQTNQFIENNGNPVRMLLNKVTVFCKGSGTVALSINGVLIDTQSITSTDRYSILEFDLAARTGISMMDYKITCSNGIKLLSRILGRVEIRDGLIV